MGYRLSLLVSLAASVLFAGCDDSKNPLSDPQDAKPDSRLVGVWRSRMKVWKGMEVTYVHVGRAGDKLPSGVMRVVGIVHDTDGTMNRPVEFLMFPTTIGTNTYLNLAPGDGKQLNLLKNKGWKSIEGYVLFKYKIEGDRLLLWKMDPDAKQRVIEDKKVKGEIREGFALDMNRLTDTTENVARFVAKEGDSLFAKEAIHAIQLDRVKSPAASGGVSDAE